MGAWVPGFVLDESELTEEGAALELSHLSVLDLHIIVIGESSQSLYFSSVLIRLMSSKALVDRQHMRAEHWSERMRGGGPPRPRNLHGLKEL